MGKKYINENKMKSSKRCKNTWYGLLYKYKIIEKRNV